MKHRFTPLLILFFGFFFHTAYSKNPKDSATRILFHLSEAYQKKKLSEKAYLDTVPVIMRTFLSENIFFTHKELLEMLDLYRQVIWKDKKNEAHKHNYYGILSNQAEMSGRDGEILYYAEKFDKLELENKHQRSLTALSLIASYYGRQGSNEKIKALYEKERNYLRSIPVIANKEKLDKNDLVQATVLLEYVTRALYELNDTLSGEEAEGILERIAAIIRAKYSKDISVIARITVTQILASYYRADAKKSPELILEAFRSMDALLFDKNTPEFMKSYMYSTIADMKTAYYIQYTNIDSAAHYLGVYEEMVKGNLDLYNVFVSKKYRARLLYKEGKYKEIGRAHV